MMFKILCIVKKTVEYIPSCCKENNIATSIIKTFKPMANFVPPIYNLIIEIDKRIKLHKIPLWYNKSHIPIGNNIIICETEKYFIDYFYGTSSDRPTTLENNPLESTDNIQPELRIDPNDNSLTPTRDLRNLSVVAKSVCNNTNGSEHSMLSSSGTIDALQENSGGYSSHVLYIKLKKKELDVKEAKANKELIEVDIEKGKSSGSSQVNMKLDELYQKRDQAKTKVKEKNAKLKLIQVAISQDNINKIEHQQSEKSSPIRQETLSTRSGLSSGQHSVPRLDLARLQSTSSRSSNQLSQSLSAFPDAASSAPLHQDGNNPQLSASHSLSNLGNR